MSFISYLDLINSAKQKLAKCRTDVTRGDLLKLLARKYLYCTEQQLRLARNSEVSLSNEIIAGFQVDITKLCENWPYAYILGTTDFFDATYKCRQGVLIPRPDSEVLVEECLEVLTEIASYKAGESLTVYEIGVGSGALLASIGSHYSDEKSELKLFASDINPLALSLAEENLQEQKVEAKLYECDLLPERDVFNTPIDVLYSNPPYISAREWASLSESVKNYEPEIALLAADNGLAVYRRILDLAPTCLHCGSYLLFEHGYAQKADLTHLLGAEKYAMYQIKKWRQDYHGQDRVLVLQYMPD